jgi:hypothetical protein
MKQRDKIIDLICFVFGSFLLIFSIFSFDHKGLIGMAGSNPIYYPFISKVGISLGAALICLGILRRNWRKRKS